MQKTIYTLKDFPEAERPRERMLHHGSSALSDSELLAIILGKGTRDMNVIELSKEVLAMHGLERLSREDIRSLSRIKGIGMAKACQISAAFELGRRIDSKKAFEKKRITCAEDAFQAFWPFMSHLTKEHFMIMHLDTRKNIIKIETAFIGTLDATAIHPREIMASLIKESASSFIIAHNHPSGNPDPSTEDKEMTAIIHDAGKLMGIPLLDHLVIGYNEYISLRDEGMII